MISEMTDTPTTRTTHSFAVSVGACITGNLLLRAASASATSIIALYLAYISGNLHDVPATFLGLLAVAFYVSELTFAPLFGSLGDRFGRRTFMLLGSVLGAGAVLILPIGPILPLFVLARVAQGLSSASSVPAVLGYLADETSARSAAVRGRIMAAFEVATIMGFALGFALGGILWDRFHVAAFYIGFVVYLLALVAFFFVGNSGGGGNEVRGWQTYKALLRHSGTLGFAPAWITVNAVLGMWFIHLGFQMAQVDKPAQLLVGGFSGTAIGLISAGLAMVFVVGTAAWAVAFGRMQTRTIMAIALMALAVFCLILFALNHAPEEAQLRIGVLTSGVVITLLLVSGFTPAALAHLAELSEHFPEDRGGMMGLYSVLLGIGQLLGGWVGGFFAEAWGVDGLILFTALLGLAASASLFGIRSPVRQNPSAKAPGASLAH